MLKRNSLRFTKAYIGLNGSGPLHTQAVTGFGPIERDELNFLLYKRMQVVVTMYYAKWIDKKIMAIHLSPIFKKKSKHQKIKNMSKMIRYQKSNYNRYIKRDLIRKSKILEAIK